MRSEPQRLQAALAAWRTLLGDVHVQTDAATLARLRQDTMRSPAHACARLRPANSEEVAACLAIARQHNVALQPASTGNNWGYGGMATTNSHCVQLDLSRMDKILAFDEALGRFSPGVLIEIANLHAVQDDPAIGWMDSCAAPDHPMIDSLWAERRTIVQYRIALRGTGLARVQRAAAFALVNGLETLASLLKGQR